MASQGPTEAPPRTPTRLAHAGSSRGRGTAAAPPSVAPRRGSSLIWLGPLLIVLLALGLAWRGAYQEEQCYAGLASGRTSMDTGICQPAQPVVERTPNIGAIPTPSGAAAPPQTPAPPAAPSGSLAPEAASDLLPPELDEADLNPP